MASKIWIGSKNAFAGNEHLYVVYDPDGDPKSGDELVWRGGPENNNPLAFGNIQIENWLPIQESEDKYPPGGDPYKDRNYTEVNTNGKTPEQVKQELSDFANALGSPDEKGVVHTKVPYTPPIKIGSDSATWIPSLNSNATVNSGLGNSGIDLNKNLPVKVGQGSGQPRIPIDTFPGGESYYTSHDGTIKISNNGKDKIIYSDGGSNTYEITPNAFDHSKTVIVEDDKTGTTDKIVIKGVDPEDIRYKREGNDLHVYFPWNEDGDPAIVIKDQWDPSGVPKMNTIWVEPTDGAPPTIIPLNNPNNFPQDNFQLPSWVPDALNPVHRLPGADVRMGDGCPLIIDLDGDGIELTTLAASATHFDFRGDGFAERMAWVKGGDGFLVRDVNGNGQIDSVREMFGSETTLGGVLRNFSSLDTENGFAKLALLDSNNDGRIDAKDAAWSSLKVWVDANGNGVTDAGELITMAATGADIFKFSTGGGIDVIKDFKISDGDKLDIKDLLTGYDPVTKAITDYIQITTVGSDSIVKIDSNGLTGGAAWTQIATIEKVIGLTDELALKNSGALMV